MEAEIRLQEKDLNLEKESTKLKIYKKFNKILRQPDIEKDRLIQGLKNLINFEHITEDMIVGLKKGTITGVEIGSEGTIYHKYTETLPNIAPLVTNEDEGGNQIVPDINFIGEVVDNTKKKKTYVETEVFESTRVMKHVVIRPNSTKTSEYKAIADPVKSGRGKKTTPEEKIAKREEHIQSLPFWDNDKKEKYFDLYTNLRTRVINFLHKAYKDCKLIRDQSAYVGNDLFKEVYPKQDHKELGYLEKSIKHFCKEQEEFYENLSFISTQGCKGHRLVTTNNPNVIGLVFPGESIVKSQAKRSFILIINKEKGVEVELFDQPHQATLNGQVNKRKTILG